MTSNDEAFSRLGEELARTRTLLSEIRFLRLMNLTNDLENQIIYTERKGNSAAVTSAATN